LGAVEKKCDPVKSLHSGICETRRPHYLLSTARSTASMPRKWNEADNARNDLRMVEREIRAIVDTVERVTCSIAPAARACRPRSAPVGTAARPAAAPPPIAVHPDASVGQPWIQ